MNVEQLAIFEPKKRTSIQKILQKHLHTININRNFNKQRKIKIRRVDQMCLKKKEDFYKDENYIRVY